MLVLSLHIILHDLLCFPIVVKALLHSFVSLYITFYLRWKCVTFLGAHIPRNAMKRSIELCLLWGQRKHLWIIISFYFYRTIGTLAGWGQVSFELYLKLYVFENQKKNSGITSPITECPGPKAQIHAHSAATVKLANPHCDSTYVPRNPIVLNLKKYTNHFKHI